MLDMGPKGSPHPAHVEKGAHRIWIAPIEGRMSIRLCHVDETHLLKPKIPEDDWNVHPNHFHADLFQPDYDKYPHLKELRVIEAQVEKGDIVFVPEGWAYQLYYDEYTVTVSHK